MKAWISTLASLTLIGVASSAAAKTLKIATIVPDGTTWMTAMRAGAEEIEQRTNGRVVLKFYPGGVMGDAQSVLLKMRVGQLHGGAFTVGGLKQVYGDAEIYGLPFLFRSYDEVDRVRARVDPLLRAGFARAGLIALSISEGGFAHLMSSQPVRQVSDLAGRKVWAQENDTMSQLAWRQAGVSPVTLPLSDVFTSLQTGSIDTVAGPLAGAIAFQWHTKVRYVTDVPLSYITGILALDQRTWKDIAAADQKIVQEVLDRVSKRLDTETRASDHQAREAMQGQGLQFVEPSAAELERWREIGKATTAKLGEAGTYSSEVLDELQSELAALRESATRAALPASHASP